MWKICVFLVIFGGFVSAEISSSSDLNCDFGSSCRWRNSTESMSGKFEVANLFEADAQNRISSRIENDPTPFAYTTGLMGRTLGLLISEVISCQLGGASLKYWYYKSGAESSLEVCIRQPPGNRDLNSMRCYDGVSTTFARQWIFRAVELPPIAQPFEIVFKTWFNPPMNIVALDDILYEATLCGLNSTSSSSLEKSSRFGPRFRPKRGVQAASRPSRPSGPRPKREIRRIGIEDWKSYKKSNLYSGELMLIVAQDVADQISSSPAPNPGLTPGPTELPPTTSTELPTTTSTEVPSTTSTEVPSTTSTELPSTTSSPPTPGPVSNLTNEQHLSNFMNFLKQAAPVIPLIPNIVKSFSSLDSGPQNLGPGLIGASQVLGGAQGLVGGELRRSPVQSSHFYNTDPGGFLEASQGSGATGGLSGPQASQETLIDLAKKFGIVEPGYTTLAPPTLAPEVSESSQALGGPGGPGAPQAPRNSFGLSRLGDSIYPQSLLKSQINPIRSKIEEQHRKIFKAPSAPLAQQPLIVYKSPSPEESLVATQLADLAQLLPQNDISALRNIPDLAGLTKGMDLTDIKRPGGFSRLKKEFMERLMRRTLGLPVVQSSGPDGPGLKFVPKPIVPMKVTRRMMAEKMRRSRRKIV